MMFTGEACDVSVVPIAFNFKASRTHDQFPKAVVEDHI